MFDYKTIIWIIRSQIYVPMYEIGLTFLFVPHMILSLPHISFGGYQFTIIYHI